jgi:hypothetical protein
MVIENFGQLDEHIPSARNLLSVNEKWKSLWRN